MPKIYFKINNFQNFDLRSNETECPRTGKSKHKTNRTGVSKLHF